jgi:hypothetical protein
MKLIEAESAKIAFCKNCLEREKCKERETVCSDYANFADTLDSMPTIDAEPVKHGRWILHREEIFEPNQSECYMSRPLPTECSVCGFAEMRASRFDFCPNCGAKMITRGKD